MSKTKEEEMNLDIVINNLEYEIDKLKERQEMYVSIIFKLIHIVKPVISDEELKGITDIMEKYKENPVDELTKQAQKHDMGY